MTTKPSQSFDAYMMTQLSTPEETRGYLEVAFEEYAADGDYTSFMLALRDVINAQGGVERLAEVTGLHKKQLDALLNELTPPPFDSVAKIIHGLGFRLLIGKQVA